MAPLLESLRIEALKKLAAERFGPINAAEEEVLQLSTSTEIVSSAESEERPEISGEFLRWLATDSEAASNIDPLGLRVNNCTITTALNLDNSNLPFCLHFQHCKIQSTISLRSATIPTLILYNCNTEHGITGDGLNSLDGVFLRKLQSAAEIRLAGAQIGGDLSCSGASLTTEGTALNADNAIISGSIVLRNGFSAKGEIRILGAQIGGSLECSGASLLNKNKTLSADRAKVSGNVFLREGFSSKGEIRLLGAQIGGGLDCDSASLAAEGNALNADGVKISGSVFLRNGFSSIGGLRFNGAQIGGNLQCEGAELCGNGHLLTADNAHIVGNVSLKGGFACEGSLRFHSAEVGGYFSCSGAKIRALYCQHTRIKGFFDWTSIANSEQAELNLLGTTVGILRDDETSWPFPGNLKILAFEYKDLSQRDATPTLQVPTPTKDRINHLIARDRIRWLKLQDADQQLDPHAWMWLAKLFKDKDDIDGYRHIVCEYRCLKARTLKNPALRWVNLRLAEIERNPWRIFFFFVPLLILGTFIFSEAIAFREIRPTNKDANEAWSAKENYQLAYPRFNPFVYTLENELPLIKFGMDDKWAPDPNLATHGAAKIYNPQLYWFLVSFRWFLIIAGWIQGILLTIGINRRFRD